MLPNKQTHRPARVATAMGQLPTHAPQQTHLYSITTLVRPRNGLGTVKLTENCARPTNQFVRTSESGMANADLAIVADRAGVERQERIISHVLREGLACS